MTSGSANCARNFFQRGTLRSAASSLRPWRASRARASSSLSPRRASLRSAATTCSALVEWGAVLGVAKDVNPSLRPAYCRGRLVLLAGAFGLLALGGARAGTGFAGVLGRRGMLLPRKLAVLVLVERAEVLVVRRAFDFLFRHEAVLVLVERLEHGFGAAVGLGRAARGLIAGRAGGTARGSRAGSTARAGRASGAAALGLVRTGARGFIGTAARGFVATCRRRERQRERCGNRCCN